jgi:flagellar biosynthetic protein FliR
VTFALPGGILLPQLAASQLVAFVLVLGRVAPLFVLAPVFSANLIGPRVKFLAAAAISVGLTPVASHGRTVPADPIGLALAMPQEILVGLAFALSLGALTAAVQAGASLLDSLVGFSFGSQIDPVNGNQSAVLGSAYGIFATMVFVVGGGPQLMMLGLGRTYDLLPLGTHPAPGALGAIALRTVEQVPVLGLELVGPVVIAIVAADAALGIVARVVPQMNVFMLGMPLKVLLAFALIGATLPFVGLHLADALTNTLSSTLHGLTR